MLHPLLTETPETRGQKAPVPHIFDEGTTPTRTLSQMFDRNPATRRKADELDVPAHSSHRQAVTEHATVVEHAESPAIED